MRTAHAVLVAVAGRRLAAMPVSRPFQAEYDSDPITLKGTVADVSSNSVHFHIDVRNLMRRTNRDPGPGSPNLLLTRGWSRDSLKIVDPVTVNGYPYPAHSRAHTCEGPPSHLESPLKATSVPSAGTRYF